MFQGKAIHTCVRRWFLLQTEEAHFSVTDSTFHARHIRGGVLNDADGCRSRHSSPSDSTDILEIAARLKNALRVFLQINFVI